MLSEPLVCVASVFLVFQRVARRVVEGRSVVVVVV